MLEFGSLILPIFLKVKADYIMLALSFILLKFLLLSTGSKYVMGIFFLDEMSMFMIIMSCWIFIVVFLVSKTNLGKIRVIIFVLISVLMFFMVDNLVLFFILFEFSLFPMLLIVIGFGQQPERIKSGRWMFIYTLLASVPLFFSILYVYFCLFIHFLSYMCLESSLFLGSISSLTYIGMIFAMMVKVPLFMTHSWLPKAHVEAPLEGSMILAGVMLKMGVYGLIRFVMFVPDLLMVNMFIFSISLVGSVYSCWMALSSNDVKMTVAYSSVSHMNFLISCLTCMKASSIISSIIIMVSHGLCSSMLFYLMTEMYIKVHSRSIYVIKGIGSQFPILMFMCFTIWSINLSAPPSMSFMGELIGAFCIISKSFVSCFLMCAYILFNSFYSLFNFSVQCHSSNVISSKFDGFKVLMILSGFLMLFPLVFMFFFFDLI
nr:NADH dehydrogenase subunit 4 [Halipeurus diversus]